MDAPPEEPACAPETMPPLPTSGPFLDPYALPLPDQCVTGGLEQLPGRWFVREPGALFNFEYPKFAGTCEQGFRRINWIEDDTDASDGVTSHTWSDGTRFYQRRHFKFENEQFSFEFASAFVACVLPDDTIAAVDATFDTDNGERIAPLLGDRFMPRDTDASGLSLVGELNGFSGLNVAVDGDYAFIAGNHGLRVIDVSNPPVPVQVGSIDGRWNDVKLVRSSNKLVAYLSPVEDERTAIIDVTDPTNPIAVGTVPQYSHSVFVAPGPRLYLATYEDTIPVYDITNPTIPVRLGAIPVPGTGPDAGIHDIHVADNRVYAMKTTDGLVALDTTPGLMNPTTIGTHTTSYSHAGWEGTLGGKRVFLHGDEGMTQAEGGAFLRVLDADPASASPMGELARYQSRPEVGIHNIVIVGERAYISYYQDGIRVIDLADPTMPTEVAHFNTWDDATAPGSAFEGAVGLTVVDDLVYVADYDRGLLILRIAP